MKKDPDNLDAALRAVLAGKLDALTPAQVERLEAVLNDRPDIAARVGQVVPEPEPRLARALGELERPAIPSAGTWAQVWHPIDTAPLRVGRRHAPWVLRSWRPLVAAAACLMLAAVWRFGLPTGSNTRPIRLATSLEVDSVEVYDGDTPFVVSIGDNGAVIIWVLEEQS